MKKSDELARNTGIISIGKLCTQFLTFILLPLYTAILTTEEYGAVDLISTYVQLLLPIVILQIDQALLRFIIDDRQDSSKIREKVSSAILFVLVQLIAFTLLYLIITHFVTIEFAGYLFLTVIVTSLSSVILQISRGLGDNVAYAFSSFLCGASTVLLNVVFLVVFHFRAEGMLLSVIAGNVLTVFYLVFKLKIWYYIKLNSFSFILLKKMLLYSLPLVPNALIWWIVNASDRTLVMMFLGTSANGVLAIAHKFPTLITTLYNIFHISWTESAALHLKEEDKNVFFSNVFDTIFRLFSSLSIGLIAVMPLIFNILINDNYHDAYYQIPIYTCASFFSVIVGLYSVIYISEMKTSEIAKTSFYSGVINVVINILLIRFIGLYAASLSSMVAFGIMALYRAFDIRKYIQQKINYRVLIFTLVMFVCSIVVYYLNLIYLNYLSFVTVVLYSIVINKKILFKIICIIREKHSRLFRV